MKQRILLCDILRGISAILIVLYHLTTRYDEMYGHAIPYLFSLPWGWMAWSIFFVLSGFLHTTEPSVKISEYVLNKAVRLYPTYWVCMIICTVFTGVFLPELMCSIKDLLIDATLLGNYLGAKSATGVDWTLSIELIFYAFVGLVILIRKKVRWEYTYEVLSLIWILTSLALIILNCETGFLKYLSILIAAPYAYMFVTGISLRMLYDGKNKRLAFANLSICMISHGVRYSFGGGYTLFYAIIVVIFVIYVLIPKDKHETYENKLSKFVGTKMLIWIASISFPLYLIHEYIGFSLIYYFDSKGLSKQYMMLIPIIISFVLAYLIHKFIEKPVAVSFKKKVFRK